MTTTRSYCWCFRVNNRHLKRIRLLRQLLPVKFKSRQCSYMSFRRRRVQSNRSMSCGTPRWGWVRLLEFNAFCDRQSWTRLRWRYEQSTRPPTITARRQCVRTTLWTRDTLTGQGRGDSSRERWHNRFVADPIKMGQERDIVHENEPQRAKRKLSEASSLRGGETEIS